MRNGFRLATGGVIAAALSLVLLAGCSTGASADKKARQVHVTLNEYKIEADVTQFKPGETVELVIENQGKEDHELESDTAKFNEILVPAGKSRTVSWTVPDKSGEYEFECDMPGHDGMEIDFVAVP